MTGWCPQFEKGAVLIPEVGEPMLLGGQESEPFAKMSAAVHNTCCFPVFMVPDEEYPNANIINFEQLYKELLDGGTEIRRIGVVGTSTIPHQVYSEFVSGFKGIEIVDITDSYEIMRSYKSPWEIENILESTRLTDRGQDTARYLRVRGRGGGRGGLPFARRKLVCLLHHRRLGRTRESGRPHRHQQKMESGELVMIGIAPRINGYAGTVGDTLPVSGTYTQAQKDCLNHMCETMRLTKAMLRPGASGGEIDLPGRDYYKKHGLFDYLVCPFAHTIWLMEAEAPFYGPNSKDVLEPVWRLW